MLTKKNLIISLFLALIIIPLTVADMGEPTRTVNVPPHFDLKQFDGIQRDYFNISEEILDNNKMKLCLIPKVETTRRDPWFQDNSGYFSKNGELKGEVKPDNFETETEGGKIKKACVDLDFQIADYYKIGSSSLIYQWNSENSTWNIYEGINPYDEEGFYVEAWIGSEKVSDECTVWYKETTSSKFWFDFNATNCTETYSFPINNLRFKVWNRDRNLEYSNGKIQQIADTFSNQFINIVQSHQELNINDIIDSPYNNVSNASIEVVLNKDEINGMFNCFSQATGIGDWFDCRNEPYYFDILVNGIVFNTDPLLEDGYTASTSLGWNNRSEFTALGARLDAPVLFMDFNNPGENPLTGYTNVAPTYVQDNSIENNYGTMSGMNGSYWVSGVSGNGLEFTPGTDAVNLGVQPEMEIQTFTVGGWFYGHDLNSAAIQRLFQYGKGGSLIEGCSIWIDTDADLWVYCYQSGGHIQIHPNNNFNDNQWYHVAITRDNSTGNVSAYIDGEHLSSSNITGSTVAYTSSPFILGAIENGGGEFDGILDDWQFYNCSLNSTQIASLNNSAGTTSLCPDDSVGLVSHWALNGTSATTATDSAGSNDGTLTNYPSDSTGTTPNYNSSCGTTGSGFDLGGCYEFDGVNDEIDINQRNNLDSDTFSAGFWIKPDLTSDNSFIFSNFAQANPWRGWGFAMDRGTGACQDGEICMWVSQSASNYEYIDYVYDFPTDEWTHWFVTYDDSTQEIIFYINGTLVLNETTTYEVNMIDAETLIGQGLSIYFDGSLDQIQVFDRVLTADEVLNLYNGTSNNSNYIGKYASDGDFKSLVFYNETSTYWNTTFSLADSTGGYEVNLSDPNLVSYWELNENFVDTMGLNNGTPSGNIVNATGISSGAMMFDGAGDYVYALDDNSLSFTDGSDVDVPFSISGWFNVNDMTSKGFISKYSGGTTREYAIFTSSSDKIYFALYDESTNGYIGRYYNTALTSYEGEWIYLTATYDGSETEGGLNLYLNNQIVDDTSFSSGTYNGMENLAVNLDIGRYSGGNYFNGSIDEVIIYNKSLTASEVEDLYKAGLTQHANANVTLETRTATSYNTSDSGLVGLWGFNGNANDELGINNGTVNGANLSCAECGVVGMGGNFDGVDDDITLPLGTSDYNTSNFAISLWVNPLVNTDDTLPFGATGNRLYINQISDLWTIGIDSLANQPTGFSSDEGSWQHLVLTLNGTTATFYKDGIAESTPTSYTPYSLTQIPSIGSINNGTSNFFNGAIDEVRIYNRSLSAAEIQNLYELGSYHIEWENWQTESVVSDLTEIQSTNASNFFQFKPVYQTDDTDVSPYILNYSLIPGGVPVPDADITPPTCVLETITPSDIQANSTGVFNAVILCNDDSGINASRFMMTRTVEDYNITGVPNYWSIRPPQNNLTVANGLGYPILRAYGRNSGEWWESLGLTDSFNNDTYSYAAHNGNDVHVNITTVNATHARLNYTWVVQPTAFRSTVWLSQEAMESEVKKDYDLNKNTGLLTKSWDIEKIQGNTDYVGCFYGNGNYTGNPDKNIDMYYCNSSFDVEGGVKPEVSPYCAYTNSMTPADLDNASYVSRNSRYTEICYPVIGGQFGGIKTTDFFYSYYKTAQSGSEDKYYFRYANGSSGSNVSFANAGVTWQTLDKGVSFQQFNGTLDIWFASIKNTDEFQLGYYVEDTAGNSDYNFSLVKDEIGDINYPITNPTILAYDSPGGYDTDLNGSHVNTMTITVGLAVDPDGLGTVNHSLHLYNTDGTFNQTINNSFYGNNGVVNVTFDTITVPDGQYKMNVTAVADDNPNDRESFLTSENFTIAQAPIVTVDYPVNGSTYTTTQSVFNYTATSGIGGDVCWYSVDGGATNSSTVAFGTNFTGVPDGEGTNTWTVYCNDTNGNVGMDSVTFIVDLPANITQATLSPANNSYQNVVFSVFINSTDYHGVVEQNYSFDGGANVTWTQQFNAYLSAGYHTFTVWITDTYGSVTTQTNYFNTIGALNLTENYCDTSTEEFMGFYQNGSAYCIDRRSSNPTVNCSNPGEVLQYNGTDWQCVNETDPLWTGNLTGFIDCGSNEKMIGINETGLICVDETDPLWSSNFTNMQSDCPTDYYAYGVYENGTLKCRADSKSPELTGAIATGTTYMQGEKIKTLTLCLDSNNDPVNSTANITIYYPNNTKWIDNVAMQEIETGLFNYSNFAPSIKGIYLVKSVCDDGTNNATAITEIQVPEWVSGTADYELPVITINSPSNNTDFTENSSVTFDISTNEDASCEVILGGTAYPTQGTSTTHNLTMNVNQGSYTFSANCTDTYGNENSTDTYYFTMSYRVPSGSGYISLDDFNISYDPWYLGENEVIVNILNSDKELVDIPSLDFFLYGANYTLEKIRIKTGIYKAIFDINSSEDFVNLTIQASDRGKLVEKTEQIEINKRTIFNQKIFKSETLERISQSLEGKTFEVIGLLLLFLLLIFVISYMLYKHNKH